MHFLGRPGDDTEWILRDDHLWLIVTEAVRQQEHHLMNAVKLLSSDFSQEMQKMANNLDLGYYGFNGDRCNCRKAPKTTRNSK
ncbi:MAG: hypothetical protein M9949_10725 [Candidatus Kapabacteria bacterium]|nr:hypothetical protein [Candidatus Kapabacteria bacterium]